MRTTLSLLVLSAVIWSCELPAQTTKPLRVPDLVQNAKTYLNQTVDVEILEPVYGAATAEDLARLEYGQVQVSLPEGMDGTLSLVPASFKATDPNRYRNKFDRVIQPPVRVKGQLLHDDDMSKRARTRSPVYVIRVSSIEPIDLGQPEKVPSLNAIKSDPAKWDRKYVVYEGIYKTGFEISALDDDIWLEPGRNAEIIKTGSIGSHANRVRVTGILFSRGVGYGHMGYSKFQIIATKIEYLEVIR